MRVVPGQQKVSVYGASSSRTRRIRTADLNDTEVVSLLDLVFEDGDGEFVMPVAEYWGEQICRVEPYFLDTVRLNEFLARHG